jgi:mannonate dehydratase
MTDNVPTDISSMLELYKNIGFPGLIRSDYVPSMADETNDHAGYGMSGDLFGIGYIRGIMVALRIPYL